MITKKITYLKDDFEFTFEPIEDSIKIKKTKTGYEVKYLIYDDLSESPREWDNLTKMVCFHKDYDLGDKHNYKQDNYNSWQEVQDAICENENIAIILPLYLYDHSGLRIKVGSFTGLLPQGHARFDSGQVGFIYVTKEALKEEGISRKRALKVLEGEVNTYDYYLSGQVYALVKETYNKDKNNIEQDNIGGYFGYKYALDALESEI